VFRASWPDETRVEGTLANIAPKVREAGMERTAMILVGRVLAADGFAESTLYAKDR
jgi:precorrin-4/cobalt-precorrin-4 C11-methyltransferase